MIKKLKCRECEACVPVKDIKKRTYLNHECVGCFHNNNVPKTYANPCLKCRNIGRGARCYYVEYSGDTLQNLFNESIEWKKVKNNLERKRSFKFTEQAIRELVQIEKDFLNIGYEISEE